MENDVIAKDLLTKFINWETSKELRKTTAGSNGQLRPFLSSTRTSDGMSMNEILIRNLYMWSDYAYDGMSYKEIANKFDLSYGHVAYKVFEMDKKIKLFFKKHIGEV
jgi:hypothetical protein